MLNRKYKVSKIQNVKNYRANDLYFSINKL